MRRWFIDLACARVPGDPIPYIEIAAYSNLMRVQLDPWEVDVLRLMDNAYLEAAQPPAEPESGNG